MISIISQRGRRGSCLASPCVKGLGVGGRCRANVAPRIQSRLDSGLVLQVKVLNLVLKIFLLCLAAVVGRGCALGVDVNGSRFLIEGCLRIKVEIGIQGWVVEFRVRG